MSARFDITEQTLLRDTSITTIVDRSHPWEKWTLIETAGGETLIVTPTGSHFDVTSDQLESTVLEPLVSFIVNEVF